MDQKHKVALATKTKQSDDEFLRDVLFHTKTQLLLLRLSAMFASFLWHTDPRHLNPQTGQRPCVLLMTPLQPYTPWGPLAHVCCVCGKRFGRPEELTQHIDHKKDTHDSYYTGEAKRPLDKIYFYHANAKVRRSVFVLGRQLGHRVTSRFVFKVGCGRHDCPMFRCSMGAFCSSALDMKEMCIEMDIRGSGSGRGSGSAKLALEPRQTLGSYMLPSTLHTRLYPAQVMTVRPANLGLDDLAPLEHLLWLDLSPALLNPLRSQICATISQASSSQCPTELVDIMMGYCTSRAPGSIALWGKGRTGLKKYRRIALNVFHSMLRTFEQRRKCKGLDVPEEENWGFDVLSA